MILLEKTNIILIGFMGTGKTAVGRRLAAIMNKDFYDTDQEVEEVTGMSILQLFSRYGEIRLRSEESLALNRLVQKNNSIIAVGGGAVLNKEDIRILAEKGIIICLSAQPEVIYERVKRRNNRPYLKKGDMYQTIIEMLSEREELYNMSDLYIDTSGLDFQDIIDRIMLFLKDFKKNVK